ncbi:Extradiol ring-cleavage dioxygenase, class III enzyme, subunit B [Plectosphaerella plurivora]|uniref:Extradiol ring-cleavage dioxygenase, class III enzyme, subunit B n=1 Tax=Plectosphaerella plurivora TaxID=936078 RepID=A0A9P8V4U3_9PEZI|nr:Extradiol ring-cleavage dioxygenase, class III enzyme, subunit B [Plectosphaerella plurivora]
MHLRQFLRPAKYLVTSYVAYAAFRHLASRSFLSTTTSATMPRGAVVCVSHGGGPMPVLGDPGHKDIVRSLKDRVPQLLRLNTPEAPRAIIVVTAHWSEDKPTISSSSKHPLLYDYGGFPRAAYSLKYDAPGSPEVANEIKAALEQEGLSPSLNATRGWDHGVFIPFLLIHPKADVPIVQLSVLASESPEEHFKMGRALSRLRDSNVAIVGSGFATFHNLREMMALWSANPVEVAALSRKVSTWSTALGQAVETDSLAERTEKLSKWREMPHSYEMHPPRGGEHFMPLLVCAAAAGDEAAGKYKDDFLGIDIWTYYWGGASLEGV